MDFKPPARIRNGAALALAKISYRECALCGETRNLHIHHVLFRSHGGDDVLENLCCLCLTCHDAIHARKRMTWFALKTYIMFEREDVAAYLARKLGPAGAAAFFD